MHFMSTLYYTTFLDFLRTQHMTYLRTLFCYSAHSSLVSTSDECGVCVLFTSRKLIRKNIRKNDVTTLIFALSIPTFCTPRNE